MSQAELLDRITKEPGILQKNVYEKQRGGGHDSWGIRQLLKKGCIRREAEGHTYKLFATGEPL